MCCVVLPKYKRFLPGGPIIGDLPKVGKKVGGPAECLSTLYLKGKGNIRYCCQEVPYRSLGLISLLRGEAI